MSGKEKGGRAIVWGDIALIDGNINARGSDITKTGGFVETSGHDLFIKDNAIVDAKEWLLDPDEVTINAPQSGRNDTNEDDEYTTETIYNNNVKYKNKEKHTLTNSTLEAILARGSYVNITAKNKINVTSDINLSNGSLTLWSEGQNNKGLEINGNITANGNNGNANLTIYSGGWLDIHSNISLREGDNINITAKGDIAFEKGSNQTIKGQGTITSGNRKGFRFENVSLNGLGSKGLLFTDARTSEGNISNYFNGTLNISGKVNISMTSPRISVYKRNNGRTFWNITTLNVAKGGSFKLSIDSRGNTNSGQYQRNKGLNGITFSGNNTFNVGKNSTVEFHIDSSIITPGDSSNFALFNGNISVLGGGRVNFKLNAASSDYPTSGVIINSKNFNVSEGSTLNLESSGSTKTAFLIKNNLTLNATGGNIQIKQIEGTDSHIQKGVVAEQNIIFEGGNITLGSQKAPTEIKGNVTVQQGTNATLRSANFDKHKGALIVKGNVTANGNLTADGDTIEIKGNLDVAQGAKFNGSTKNNLNITGTFTNNGTADINIKQGVVNIQGNITNKGGLNITTNAQNNQKTIINGNITNEGGDLNIKDSNNNAEIQIGGNISQKKGNLTISSDKINITKKITIKAGVDEGGSDSSPASNANLTIKTKTLELTGDLNISGFNKAEITAKNGNDLTIGKASDGNANAKKVTFDKVKDSKISAEGHGVTLNSKVESSGDSSTENGSDGNNIGLTISAKDVTVNSNITSHKTVNISASEGGITTKAGTTINATTGSVEVTAKTGDIKGGIESTSGSVTLTATGDALTVSNVTAKDSVTVKAEQGTLTTTSGGTIKSEENKVELTAQSGSISGNVEGKNQVNITASTGDLTIGNSAKVEATGAATLTAESGKLTTQAGSSITSNKGKTTLTANNSEIAGSINATDVTLNTTGTLTTATGSSINAANGNLVINAQDATLNGDASGDRTEVNAVNASGSGNVTAAISSNVNITGDLSTVNGLNIISKNGKNTVVLKGAEIDVKYIQPGVASVEEVIEAKRVLEKVKDLSDEERETLAKLGVSAVRFVEPNNTITVNTQNEFTTRPSSQVTISEGKACFSSGNGAAVCTNITDGGQQ
ncbi:hypothetical protein BV082_01864 [Haemophilus influenzae]|uniref:beta strand repeat-containing protein n=1 Tax=Haemophilus influenzae TaxID=727 RepID=UPI000D015C0F|nr:adhesin [Haemophilus influenzae]PRL45116.1 hypothetical protein BV082_01864 [Haemophilus influenzae]